MKKKLCERCKKEIVNAHPLRRYHNGCHYLNSLDKAREITLGKSKNKFKVKRVGFLSEKWFVNY